MIYMLIRGQDRNALTCGNMVSTARETQIVDHGITFSYTHYNQSDNYHFYPGKSYQKICVALECLLVYRIIGRNSSLYYGDIRFISVCFNFSRYKMASMCSSCAC
jgi:hypothetical protein